MDRKEAWLLYSGTLSPNPWDLSLSGQNGWFTLEALERKTGRRRDAAPSADSSAGTGWDGFEVDAVPTIIRPVRH
jgi:hypothetical protein